MNKYLDMGIAGEAALTEPNRTEPNRTEPLDYGFYLMDCMNGMAKFPDKYFDLAIVDPVYGDVTKGGYMKNLDSTTKLAKPIQYHLALYSRNKTME